MNISHRWLQALVPGLRGSPKEIADRLAMYGAPVDEIVEVGAEIAGVVIARVISARRHPNADRLNVCQVDAGTGTILNVVCGAPNVRADTFYPFAPVGTTLPGGITLKKAKIRGEESQGMLCSARELGLGRDHEGILTLHGDFTPGESFTRALGLDDARIVVDVTANRPDLLSHLGVARELAPHGEEDIVLPSFPGARAVAKPEIDRVERRGVVGGVTVSVEDATLCPRYMAAVVRGVTVGPSPEWLAARLRVIGQRPINNVVDATNYVLHELGQPLHAFDLKQLRGSEIIVRTARGGEKLTTLDGVERKLGSDMLVIADGVAATAVAGVMGGGESEVTDATVDLLIECAHFEPKQVRRTRRALGLSTDASYRFERGVDPTGMERALARVVDLIVATAGGEVDPHWLDIEPEPLEPAQVEVRLARVEQVLGRAFTAEEITALVEPLGFRVLERHTDRLSIGVPGHRRFDVFGEIDIVEEIARRYGYDNFSQELTRARPSSVPDDPMLQLEDALRDWLVGHGLLESRTAGFAGMEEGDIELMLPLASTESRLRRAVLPGLLQRVEYNFTRGARDIRLFELGTAFAAGEAGQLPVETRRLTIVLTGGRRPAHWSGPVDDVDLWDLKGLLEEFAARYGLEVAGANGGHIAGTSEVLLEDERFALRSGDVTVGLGGRIDPEKLDAPAWAAPVYGLEIVLDERWSERPRRYQALPVHPAIEQDLALLVPDEVSAAVVGDVIRSTGGALLETVEVFDLYRGTGLPAGTRSIAFRLRFRAADRTLTDQDAAKTVKRILQRLKDEYSIERRG